MTTTTTRRGFRTGRGLVLGGLGLVGMVVLLVAPAFACSASGPGLTIFPTAGPPETPFEVNGKGYDPEIPIDLRWNGQVVETVYPDEAGNFRHQMVAPANTSPNFYQVQAVQMTSKGRGVGFAVFKVEAAPVVAPPVVDNPEVNNPVDEPVRNPVVAPVVKSDPAPAPADVRTPAASAPARTLAPARPAATEQVTATPTAAAPAPGASTPAPAAAPADRAVTSPAPMQAPLPELAIPDATDLWSGMEAQRVPSLVDVPTSESNGTAAVGMGLFAAGAVVLGSLATVAGRRRFALATTTRS